MALPKILLHIPHFNIHSIDKFKKTEEVPTKSMIYNLSNFKFIEYDKNTKMLSIAYNDNTIYKIYDDEDNGSVQNSFQEISRLLFTSEDTKIVRL
jgi:hypothetical protein